MMQVTDEQVERLAAVLETRLDLNGHTHEGIRRVARAALEAVIPQWQPIDTAPATPSTQPLPNYALMFNGYHIDVGWRQEPDDPEFGPSFWSEIGEPIEPPPTHWMPIPPPPADRSEPGAG